jgi:hypothetical protein
MADTGDGAGSGIGWWFSGTEGVAYPFAPERRMRLRMRLRQGAVPFRQRELIRSFPELTIHGQSVISPTSVRMASASNAVPKCAKHKPGIAHQQQDVALALVQTGISRTDPG